MIQEITCATFVLLAEYLVFNFSLDSPNETHKTSQFNFLFLLRLRHMDKTSSLVDLIKKQHSYLEDVDKEKISAILRGKTGHKVALLLDGYDEYKKGKNMEIDKMIDSPNINTFLVLTSRPGYVEKDITDKVDGEVVIEGFSEENIHKCSEKYLGSERKSNEMLRQADEAGIISVDLSDEISGPGNETLTVKDGGLLHVPIILLMTCVLFEERQSLPKTKTSIVGQIFELTIDRTVLKSFSPGMYADVKEFLDDLLFALGEISWESLNRNEKQLLLSKVSFVMVTFQC